MKVIAAISDHKALVEMTRQELERLCGGTIRGCMSDHVGIEYAVLEAWNKLSTLQTGQYDLANAAARLRAIADLLQPIACEVNELIDG